MADVFISYHEASAGELAETIAERLDNAGISCWCARRDLPFGGDFAREIPPQIDTCKVFLLLLNEDVYTSDHIENEVGLAFGRRNAKENITILPVEIGNFQRKSWIKYYLIHTQSVKFPANPNEQRIQGLVKRLAKLLGKEPAKIVKRGKCGDNVNFTLDENGVLTLFGRGAIRNFEWDSETKTFNTPWWDKRKAITHVEIQDSVTSIGVGAFYDCAGLISVTISADVTIIGNFAFQLCAGLISVTIPNGVTGIGIGAFLGCIRLTSIIIPDSVTYIGAWTFRDCIKLTSATIPDSVNVIDEGTFYDCWKLTSVTIPDSVTFIEKWSFGNCNNLTSVSVPAKADIHFTAFPESVRIERRS